MEPLLRELLTAPGVSGYEGDVAKIMERQLRKSCQEVQSDSFGNVIARKGAGPKKIMLAAHMDEVGLLVKHITREGFIHFIKIGGIDDRLLLGQRVVIKTRTQDVCGIIGVKPVHLQKEEDKKHPVKYEDMFIDIGASSKDDAAEKVSLADPVIFEPNFGKLSDKLYYGKAADDRVGCAALLKIMERINVPAQVYAVATAQEEVGLKGARTSSFRINPDFAIAIDTTIAGDTPHIKEKESPLRLGNGVAITLIEAAGRGIIVNEKIKQVLLDTAKKYSITHQVAVLEGGMTDGAMIYMNREGIPTAVLSVPCRYVHSPTGVFHIEDVHAAVELAVKVIERVVGEG
ncbi:MAG TPA: M42 family metallopeptidase [Patescibacteria group bacterium]|nr:M42 family metallopeptidase [Patescibacteria group bacterium]